jgi:lauroyl/myristoyl acyltransferase
MVLPRYCIPALYRHAEWLAKLGLLALPGQRHPGRRAYSGVANLGLAPGKTPFATQYLAAQWRSWLLEYYLGQSSAPQLQDFIEHRVSYEHCESLEDVLQKNRPIIFCTPHYGTPIASLMLGQHLLKQRRRLNIFYNKNSTTDWLAPVLGRLEIQAQTLHSGRLGIRSSLQALGRNECIAILPDGFDDLATTLVVPFFNRLLRIGAGTALLAYRSHALIVPVFAIPADTMGLRVRIAGVIDPLTLYAEDEAQALFALSQRLFACIEEQLRFEPEHWHYWDKVTAVSTRLDSTRPWYQTELQQGLHTRWLTLPHSLRNIPELQLLLPPQPS